MLELVKEILKTEAGSFGFIFSLICVVIWLVHYITKKVTEINSDHRTIEKNSDKMSSHIDEIRKDMSYLKGSIDILKTNGTPELIKSNSPISLTAKGVEVAEELRANEIITKNWDKILSVLDKNISNKNAYDIQTYCMETVAVQPELFFDSESLTNLKNIAFKEGKPFQYYSNVFGVLIRDKYLKHKNIDLSEIDAYDPKLK